MITRINKKIPEIFKRPHYSKLFKYMQPNNYIKKVLIIQNNFILFSIFDNFLKRKFDFYTNFSSSFF